MWGGGRKAEAEAWGGVLYDERHGVVLSGVSFVNLGMLQSGYPDVIRMGSQARRATGRLRLLVSFVFTASGQRMAVRMGRVKHG